MSAPLFGCRVRVELAGASQGSDRAQDQPEKAILRPWKAGDRVRLRYSSGPRKIKEVLERMNVTGTERVQWPVLEVGGRILWMRGAELEPDAAIRIFVEPLAR
jgi:tRNA(Ile)-lysidine synthase